MLRAFGGLSTRERVVPYTCASSVIMYLTVDGHKLVGRLSPRPAERNGKATRNAGHGTGISIMCSVFTHLIRTRRQGKNASKKCKHSRDHEGEIVVLMHADPSALLPGAKDLGDMPQMYSDHIVTKKRISIDPAKFARDGFGSLSITFSESDRLLLEDLMQEAAKSKGRSRLHYLDDGGRVGYIISLARAQASAFGGAMRRTLSGGILDSVAFYMGGYAKVFSIEVIEITQGVPLQDVHSDIRDTAIISTLGAVTTEVFPNRPKRGKGVSPIKSLEFGRPKLTTVSCLTPAWHTAEWGTRADSQFFGFVLP